MRTTTVLSAIWMLFSFQSIRAQLTPQTVLWKITGKNGRPASYLFGTMHSGDKRVYYLGDSVYKSIEACDGFAMELDPGEMIDTLVADMTGDALDVSYKEAIENDLVKKDPDFYRKQIKRADSLLEKLRQRYSDMSPRDIERLRRLYRKRNKNDMKTVLDLYLFDLAKKQGKVVSGIEDISDQTALKDELGNDFDPDTFLKNQRKKYLDVTEWIIDVYTRGELDKIREFSTMGSTAIQNSKMLYNRNYKMTVRMDSLMAIRTSFFAVGAAHLPGDSGVIRLLQQKGFTVTPVFSSRKIEPGEFETANRLTTTMPFTDADSNYLVQLPGKPTSLTAVTRKIILKTYKEFSNEIMLMCGTYEDGNLNKSAEKHLQEIKDYYKDYDVKIYSTDTITKQGLKGYSISFKHPDAYMLMHLFYREGKLYLFAAGSKDKDSLKSIRCNSFLASCRILDGSSKKEMKTFRSAQKAFAVTFPALPKTESIQGEKTITKEEITLFSSTDSRDKINYLVLVKEPHKGYFFDFDSTLVVQTVEEIKKEFRQEHFSEEKISFNGYPAIKIRMKGIADGKDQIIYSLLTVRDNRLFALTTRGLATPQNEQNFEKFTGSFSFLPYEQTAFTTQQGAGGLFTVLAPGAIQEFNAADKKNGARRDYFAFDSNNSLTYSITGIPLDKYYWAADNKELLEENAAIYYSTDPSDRKDSLVYKKETLNGKTAGREILTKSLRNNSFTRLRLMLYADTLYVLSIKSDQTLCSNKAADDFFNSFRFGNEVFTTTAFQSKTTKLVADLQSVDNAVSQAAAQALYNGYKYPAEDETALFNALFYEKYGQALVNNLRIPELLAYTLQQRPSEQLVTMTAERSKTISHQQLLLRTTIINMLSGIKTAHAYAVLKELLMGQQPENTDYTTAVINISNNASTAAALFPELAVKLKDDAMLLPVLAIANRLTDSNAISFAVLEPYQEDILRKAKFILRKYQEANNDNFAVPYTEDMLAVLAKLNQKQTRSILNDFLELKNTRLSIHIIGQLAKNKQAVSETIINDLCKKPDTQLDLYDELLKQHAAAYFKGDYASQRSFADAFVKIYTLTEIPENIPRYFDFIETRQAAIGNSSYVFYIYKVTCSYRRGDEKYTCIMGPFSTNTSSFSIKPGEELYILYRSRFSADSISNLFDDFIKKIKSM